MKEKLLVVFFSFTVLANLITMAPGTLSLGYTPDRSHLIIHAMYLGDREAFVEDVPLGAEFEGPAFFRIEFEVGGASASTSTA